MTRANPRSLMTAALAVLAAGCGGGGGDGWAGRVDTLAGGRVVVTSPEQGAWREGQGWQLVEELRIGSAGGEGPDSFGAVVDVEPDARGRLWVADGMAAEIRVFGPDGRHVRTVGRAGGGPGEFRQLGGMEWAPDGRLWVYDGAAARFSVFDTAGAYVAGHRRAQALVVFPWRGGFDARGRLHDPGAVVGPDGARTALFRLGADLSPVDTLLVPRYQGERIRFRRGAVEMSAAVPFAADQRWARSRAGGLWIGVTGRYALHHVGYGGDTTRTVARAHTPVPVSAAERDEALRRFRAQGAPVDARRVPAAKPAFSDFFEDGAGRLWVTPARAAGEPPSLDVFDTEGRYLGRVRPDRPAESLEIQAVRGDALYAVVRDESDVEYVVRYRIAGR